MMPFHFFIKTLTLLSLLTATAFTAIADTKKENQEQQQFVELLPKDFRPAFTRDTVIKLNAIVRRSYDVINDYDAVIEKTRSDLKQASSHEVSQKFKSDTMQQVSKIRRLEQLSSLALSDMMKAVKVLEKSDEDYNKAILAGMVDFVKDVKEEITKKNAEISTLLENV